MKLPKHVAFKSIYNNKYLRYRAGQGEDDESSDSSSSLQFSGDEATNLLARFEVVRAAESGSGGLVHLKCAHNGKYLVRQSPDGWWIRGGADRPEENRSLGHYACLFRIGGGSTSPFNACLYAGWKDPRKDLSDLVTIVDLDTRGPPEVNGGGVDEQGQRQSADQVNSFFMRFKAPKPHEERPDLELTIVSSANDYWGAIFGLSAILPKAIPDLYDKIRVHKGDGFTEGSIRQVVFSSGTPWKASEEEIVHVDHAKKTVTWSVIDGGMMDYYDIFKITVTVTPKLRPMGYGSTVNWSCEAYGGDSKGIDLNSMKHFVKSTFEMLDMYLLRELAREVAR